MNKFIVNALLVVALLFIGYEIANATRIKNEQAIAQTLNQLAQTKYHYEHGMRNMVVELKH